MQDIATLLVVDDEEMVLDMTEHALKDGGYQVVRARSGDDAIALLEADSNRFAGLITDVNLGEELDGWRVAQRARELKPAIPIVYTTGFSSRNWTARGVPNSIVVQKPFSVDEIVAAIWTLLNGVEV
ncbi:MAG TPA: response regulator [Allosphingosinicella sp.]